jgi:hypothetical protein
MKLLRVRFTVRRLMVLVAVVAVLLVLWMMAVSTLHDPVIHIHETYDGAPWDRPGR